MLEFSNPIPVVTDAGAGYAIYVRDGGTWENDVRCVAMEEGGLSGTSAPTRSECTATPLLTYGKPPQKKAKKDHVSG